MSSTSTAAPHTLRGRSWIGAIAVAILISATTAQAWIDEDDEVFNHNGGRVSFSGLVAFETFSDGVGPGPNGSNAKKVQSSGLQARYSYRFHPSFAAEAQFEWVDGWALKSGHEVDHIITGTANLKGFFLQNFYQPYLVIGVGASHIREVDPQKVTKSDTALTIRAGAGIDVYVNETIGFNFEYSFVQPLQSLSDYQYQTLAFGFFLRF